MKKGRFVVIEGGDGSGKTTVINYLKDSFPEADFRRVFTREPGGTGVADEIRSVLLKRRDGEEIIEPETEILLFEASRAQHLINVVRPAVERGELVITDRFDSSTYAYEISGNGREDLKLFFQTINELVVGDTVPDLYIYLDVDVKVGKSRQQNRDGDRGTVYDVKESDYHERVRAGYLEFFRDFRPGRHLVIDANQSLEQVRGEVERAIVEIWSGR